MGNTHFRSDVRESGARTASFSTYAAGTISATGTITGTGGLLAGAGKYIKLGSIYIITGAPTAFSKAGIDAIATAAAGVAANTSIPRGSIFLNASVGMTASQGVYVKVAPATWAVVTTGSQV
jgi:hypothetical protein